MYLIYSVFITLIYFILTFSNAYPINLIQENSGELFKLIDVPGDGKFLSHSVVLSDKVNNSENLDFRGEIGGCIEDIISYS